MNRNALLIALLTAALGASLLVVYLRKFEQEKSGGERVSLLMVTKPIERGKIIEDDALSDRLVPLAYVEARAVKSAERSKIVGLRAGQNLQAQDTLMWTDLDIVGDEHHDLSALITPGNRAFYLKALREDKGASLIRPGDYVDVLATMPERMADGKVELRDSRAAVVLLQRVLVLAVGRETTATSSKGGAKPESGASSREYTLTVSVNLQEAQLMALALDKGVLSVALRNPDDLRVVDAIPDLSSTALSDGRARALVQASRRSGAIPVRLEAAK